MHLATETGNMEVIETLLDDFNADVKQRSKVKLVFTLFSYWKTKTETKTDKINLHVLFLSASYQANVKSDSVLNQTSKMELFLKIVNG